MDPVEGWGLGKHVVSRLGNIQVHGLFLAHKHSVFNFLISSLHDLSTIFPPIY